MAEKGNLKDSKYIINWIHAAAVRAIKTFAQTCVGTIGVSVALSDVSWGFVLSSASLAAIVSLLTSVAGLPEVDLQDALLDTKGDDNSEV